MDNIIDIFLERINHIETADEYDDVVRKLNQALCEAGYSEQICEEVKRRQKYIKNRFSDEANKEKMLAAKENLSDYLFKISQEEIRIEDIEYLDKYLRNFYMFLEAFTEGTPDKRATLTENRLHQITVGNEYDLQYLLQAVLKPLYPDIRKETAEDSGVGMVRGDLKIQSLDLLLEVKCTRKSMSLKKLTEEIEADIVHYQEKYIFFYIFDKEKIIKEKQNFENRFNHMFDKKNVRAIIQQPINI